MPAKGPRDPENKAAGKKTFVVKKPSVPFYESRRLYAEAQSRYLGQREKKATTKSNDGKASVVQARPRQTTVSKKSPVSHPANSTPVGPSRGPRDPENKAAGNFRRPQQKPLDARSRQVARESAAKAADARIRAQRGQVVDSRKSNEGKAPVVLARPRQGGSGRSGSSSGSDSGRWQGLPEGRTVSPQVMAAIRRAQKRDAQSGAGGKGQPGKSTGSSGQSGSVGVVTGRTGRRYFTGIPVGPPKPGYTRVGSTVRKETVAEGLARKQRGVEAEKRAKSDARQREIKARQAEIDLAKSKPPAKKSSPKKAVPPKKAAGSKMDVTPSLRGGPSSPWVQNPKKKKSGQAGLYPQAWGVTN